jgi:LysM repeat protein
MLKKFFCLSYVVFVLVVAGCATIPQLVPPASIPAKSAGVYHIVASKETLWRIAKAYNTDIDQILRANRILDPRHLGVGQRLFIPGARCPLISQPPTTGISMPVESLVGPVQYKSRWRAITVHHSATLGGSAGIFDRNHRARGMGGLFYHFVIGNGRGSPDGQIEVGWRWRAQSQVNRPNEIEICLVGDFNRQDIASGQWDSLVKLISVLRRQYNIPVSCIRKHKDVTSKATECPGQRFPFYRLIAELKRIQP